MDPDGQWAKFGGSVWNNAKKIKRKTSGVLKKAHESISQYPRPPEWVLPLLIPPQSPTPHLLCCNYPPTDTELCLISDMIVQVKAVADRLQAELDNWRRESDPFEGTRLPIKKMEHSLESAKEFIKKHQAILSAIRRLPAEILQEIIALSTVPYLDVDRTAMGPAEVESSFYRGISCLPLAQSQVSRFWRDTAISSSALWNKLPSFPLDQPYTTSPRFLFFLDTLLAQRCAKKSLDFHIHSRSPDFVTPGHPVMARLLSRSSCWKRAVFQVPTFHWALFCGVSGRLASLQSLVIVFPPRPLQIYHPMTIDLFQNAPRLRSVIFVRVDASLFLLPHRQLIHYREDQCESTSLDQILESPSSLQTLEFKEDFFFLMSAPGRIALMNELTVLRMQLLFHNDECPILNSLILPALKELSIKLRVSSALHTNVIPPIHSMILRSGQPSALEKLQVYSGHLVARELSSLLRDTPLLTHLNVSLPPAEDIRRLAVIEGDDVIAPLLRVCTFYLNTPLEQGVFQSQHEERSVDGLCDQNQARLCRRLAANRCERPAGGRDRMGLEGGDDSLISGSSVKCLRAFYIDCKDNSSTATQRNTLQQWSEESLSFLLQDIRDVLIDHIRGTARSNIMSPNSIRVEVRHVRGVLTTLKNLEIRRVEDIYVSKIHRTLDRMVKHFGTFKGPQHAYSQDAQEILNKWTPLFQASLNGIHWGIYCNYVYYLPNTSPLRTSSTSLTRVAFGYYQKNDIHYDDPPWPMTASAIQDANSP